MEAGMKYGIRLSQWAIVRTLIATLGEMLAPTLASIKFARKCGMRNPWLAAAVISVGFIPGLGLSTARAQIVDSALVGTAFDPTGAAVPNAQITVTNLSTQLTRTSVTDSSGHYVFPTLPPGSYNLTAVGTGFQKVGIQGISLTVGQTTAWDVHFKVGSVAEEVTARANAANVETESSSLGQLIGTQQVENLPLNGRNYVSLSYLGSGSNPQVTNASSPVMSNVGRPDFTAHISGGRGDANSWLVDGVETRSYFLGQPDMIVSLDAVQEFRVQKNMFEAQYGNASGIVSVITKSGTNSFHGSVYEYFRNTKLDGANFFSNRFGLPKPQYTWNQFGVSAGGPIWKNRIFIFGNYEGFRNVQEVPMSGNVPTPAEWAGDESALVATSSMKDPITGQPAIINPFTGQAFPGGQIPAAMLSSVMQNLKAYSPVANANLPGINFVTNARQVRDENQGTVRLDWTVGEHDNLFGRYIKYNSDFTIPGLLPLYGSVAPIYGQNVALEETHVFSHALINSFKLGYNRDYFIGGNVVTSTNVASDVGLKNINVPPTFYGVPAWNIAGNGSFGAPPYLQGDLGNTYQLTDELNWVHGRHAITFGGDIRRKQIQFPYGFLENGNLNFDGRYTGASIADMVLGAAAAAGAQQTVPLLHFFTTTYAFYVQDAFKVTPKLTLNLGLRYEYRQPPWEENGEEGFFDPSIDALRVRVRPGQFNFTLPTSQVVLDPSYRRGIWKPERNNWAPRLGFAYSLTRNTVLRGGAGMFYSDTQGQEIQGKVYMPPMSFTINLTGNPTGVPNVLVDQMFPSPANAPPGALSPFTVNPNDKTPYLEQWNLGIQHTFGPSTLLEVAYVGSVGKHLNGRYNLNQALTLPGPTNIPLDQRRPFPAWSDMFDFAFREHSSYNALQAKLEKHMSHGLSLLVGYTWAHALDTIGSDSGTGHQNTWDPNADYGNSDLDVRHNLNFSYVYELPFGRGKRFLGDSGGVVNKVVGGWSVQGITYFMTGNYFEVATNDDSSNTGGFHDQRANINEGCKNNGNLPHGQRTISRYFDTSCFSPAPFGTFGNTSRGIIQIPGLNYWDLSLFKTTHITERLTTQFRAEFFNAWNHAQFGPPDTNPLDATFGQITNTLHDNRHIQFALRLDW
jgi:hypothetical protein